MSGSSAASAAAERRDQGVGKAQLLRFLQALVDLADGPHLTAQADLAEDHRPGWHRTGEPGGEEGRRDRQIGRRFPDSQAIVDPGDPCHRAGSPGRRDSLFDAAHEPVQSNHPVADIDFDVVAVELCFAHSLGDLFGELLVGRRLGFLGRPPVCSPRRRRRSGAGFQLGRIESTSHCNSRRQGQKSH